MIIICQYGNMIIIHSYNEAYDCYMLINQASYDEINTPFY